MLAVEDEDPVTDVFPTVPERMGDRVLTAPTGRKAVETAGIPFLKVEKLRDPNERDGLLLDRGLELPFQTVDQRAEHGNQHQRKKRGNRQPEDDGHGHGSPPLA